MFISLSLCFFILNGLLSTPALPILISRNILNKCCDFLIMKFLFRRIILPLIFVIFFCSFTTFVWIKRRRMANVYISSHTQMKNNIGIWLLLVVAAPTWHHWTVLKYWNAPITAASLTNTWNGDQCSRLSLLIELRGKEREKQHHLLRALSNLFWNLIGRDFYFGCFDCHYYYCCCFV